MWRINMSEWRCRSLVQSLGWAVLLAGCGGTGVEGDEETGLGSVQQALGARTLIAKGAEVAVSNVGADGTLVLTANEDDVPPFMEFPPGSRIVRPGVTMMGYRRYNPTTNALLNVGTVFNTANWSGLWGDPGVTRHRNQTSRMYLTNLAIPANKFPASGQIVGSIAPDGLPANMCGSYIGGACIARSSNSGALFTLAAADCVRRVDATCPFGHFYDGADLETGSVGQVYAAYNDTNRSRIDVWMAQNQLGPFGLVTDTPIVSSSHPRLRVSPSSGLPYLAVTSGGNLRLTRYDGVLSRTGAWSAPVTVATGITQSAVVLSDRSIRLGPQYDLAIGPNEQGVEEVRLVYTVLVNGQHKVRVSHCSTGAVITCANPVQWRTDAQAGKQWGPAITTGVREGGATRHWSISYYSTISNPGSNLVDLWGGLVEKTAAAAALLSFKAERAQVPCPDSRAGGGYWGDYDEMSSGPSGLVYRGFSDSSAGNCVRDTFTSSPLSSSISKWTL
jgi:hypothetical protein